MTALEIKEIEDTLEWRKEWRELLSKKISQRYNPSTHPDQVEVLKAQINELLDDLHIINEDIENILKRHLPSDYMTKVHTFINARNHGLQTRD